MRSISSTARLLGAALTTALSCLASAALAQSSVDLTAAPTKTVLPDGQSVPMWGYRCTAAAAGASCAAAKPATANASSPAYGNWSPVVVTVPYAGPNTSLTINLRNQLAFTTADPAKTNAVPTSIVIVGQLGGGLGSSATSTPSPVHAPLGLTWPSASGPDTSAQPGGDPSTAGNPTFNPPAQPARVQSFATEVPANGVAVALTWSNLRPGTYLIHSGTHPSIQEPMGLYGVLVVTTPAAGAAPAQAYAGQAYDADVPLVFSEIDPVQNAAVNAAVGTAGFSETAVWSGQPGGCGDSTSTNFNTCYPPVVNYSPLYYLINGVSLDRTNLAASTFAAATPTAASANGRLLLRLVNAGLRMHVPSVVNAALTLVAEDGNPLPGAPRVQNEVFLAAGKAYDVAITPAQSGGAYTPANYAVFDRELSLSTANQRDGGMLAYVAVAGGASTGVGSASSATTLAGVSNKTYYCSAGSTLAVTDASRGVLGGVVGANGAALVGAPALPGVLAFQSNGTFVYTAPASGACGGSFSFAVNGIANAAYTATIAQCDATSAASGCPLGGAPTAVADAFPSNVATTLHVPAPGVLANDTDPAGLQLKVDVASVGKTGANAGGLTLAVLADGSLTASAAAPGAYTFTYKVQNAQGTDSVAPATVTLNFPAPGGLAVHLADALDKTRTITDYRWIIEEDRTFWVDPKCQLNSTDPALRPTSCPPLPVQSLGYNFHTANMPVIAAGCVGTVSCEAGQSVLGAPAACDQGNGVCSTSAKQKVPLDPAQVALDPAKRYYLSVMPADGINPTLNGQGGAIDTGKKDAKGNPVLRKFATSGGATGLGDCTSFEAGVGNCGHSMGGAQIAAGQTSANIALQRTPLPTAQITVFVFEDDNPLNGENDAGGGVDVLAPNEPGLGSFNIVLLDQAGGLGDNTGQITYDMFNMPVTNGYAGYIDPLTTLDACPITARPDALVGVIVTCPKYEADGKTLSPLAGQAVIKNLYPGLYEIQAMPAADRIARGEEWLQTNTLDGGKPHEAFVKPDEPAYFQEFGPGGFHVSIGFANPKIINDRLRNTAKTGLCDPALPAGGGGLSCTASLYGQVQGTHMSRTPDQRTFASGDYTFYGFTQCYIGIGPADGPDFAFAKCDQDGNFQFAGIPEGDYKLTVFDQWNDIMLDGLVTPVHVAAGGSSAAKPIIFPVTQWRTNLYTRTFIDSNRDGVSNLDANGNPTEPGLPLIATNIRYRDGSYGFFNTTDLNGYAAWNEVFPFMNWLVVEADATRYKQTGTHVVVDTGGPVDGTTGGGQSTIAAGLANTLETNSLPAALRVPGAVYCANADCSGASIAQGPYGDNSKGSGPLSGLSSGRIDPPQAFGTTEAWQGLLGQSTFMEFGMAPFVPGDNGGIRGHVIYASTRPFDDPQLLLQLQWEPGVPRVRINLYQEGAAADGKTTLKLVDTTTTTSFDDWAQGFRRDASGKLMTYTDASGHSGYIPNMNCPGQDPGSPFYATLKGSTQWLDNAAAHPDVVAARADGRLDIAANSQFKCYDGWSQLNQAQPAPYDGKYKFPSVTMVDAATGRPAGTNCKICNASPANDGTQVLPPGKYVVEVLVPAGFELVKEEDKNILMGDIYIAPVTIQFPGGVGNVFIMPDQATVNSAYNKNNAQNPTTNLGSVTFARHEGDTGSIESYWPCVGAARVVPDYLSLYPGVQQVAPFAGATRPLCDRKEVTLEDQSSVLAKFYVFTPTQIAGHFAGTMTNDFASEFDPFSPQFGEKFGPPNLPVGMRDFAGNEMGRVYADQWGIYDGLFYSSWEVNPPNPTGFAPQMSIACMNDPGPIAATNLAGQMVDASGAVVTDRALARQITDPSYNPAYSNFCYETPFMPGFTAYMDTPVIPTQAFADGYNLPDAEYPDGTPAIASVNGEATGPWVSAAGKTLTITALGDKVVQNPDFSGPGASVAPYNQKTITRHYGFGNTAGSVTIAGVAATCTWGDMALSCGVPTIPANLNTATGVGSTCASTNSSGDGQTPMQRGVAPASLNNGYRCGELVITTADGKRSIDAVTVTVGGKPPTVVAGENVAGNAIQTAVDNAAPGDLIIVAPGTYKEHVLMWKPVRLQGSGAASTTINADAHPSGILDPWRRQVNCLFGLTLDGVPNPNDAAFDPSGQYSCPRSQFLRVDRIPFEAIIGWDASGNGNLAQVLQEPTLMGAYEGAGVTVLGRGARAPASGPNSTDFWGQNATGGAGAFTDGSVWLSASNNDCRALAPTDTSGRDYGTGNFYCNPSRIDGLSITNSSQGGGAIFVHGWGHNLDVANTRIFANHGTLTGGINLGSGETPDAYINDGVECGVNPAVMPCPPIPRGTVTNAAIPFAFNTNVHVHHNAIYNNASVGDALFSGTPSGAGAVTISAGADNYQLDHNWIAGNLSTGDGGGVVHLGLSFNGRINNNFILFNQSTNPTLPTNGGGLAILGANQDQLVAGVECGSTTDNDCPPGIGEGTGPGLVIDSNLILGNSAESGSGGGLRLQQINGSEVSNFRNRPNQWYDVSVTNNIIANNVAGWDGAGISLEDTLRASVINNTIVANDTTASAGVLFKTLGAINASSPPPGCATDPVLAQTAACLNRDAAHAPQPAGLVVSPNTPNLQAAMNGGPVNCPVNHGYTAGNCKAVSIPVLTNDLFWQNRAFHVEISGSGTGLQSQQNLIALVPQLNQTATGFCAASGLSADGKSTLPTNYWDVGVRGDIVPNDGAAPGSGGAKLTLNNSILTPVSALYNGAGNLYPTVAPVNAMYCNGSRVPPGNGGHGYQSPPGASETTGLATLFVFNNIAPAATVDEGNNWINLSYGPLTLFNAAGKAMLATGSVGPNSGAYSINGTSAAVNHGTASGAPALDFFGTPRSGSGAVDIGAVEYVPPAIAMPVVAPSTLAFGSLLAGSSATQDLTLVNNGGAAFTGMTVGATGAAFALVNGPGFPFGAPNCRLMQTLVAGASCTIRVQFTAPAPGGTAATGAVNIAGNVAVSGAPVALGGSSVAPTYTVSVAPATLAFGNWAVGTSSVAQNLSVTNTGNAALAGLNVALAGGTPQVFTRVNGGAFPVGAPNCGATLAVGASCTVKLTFTPTAAQVFARTLAVTATGVTTPASATLTGTGVAARAALSIAPAPLTITLPRGAFTGTGSVTLTNAAGAAGAQVAVGNVAVTGGNGFNYAFNAVVGADNCSGVALAPGASCTVGVRFTNAGAARGANRSGTISFTDSGAGSPQTSGLIGFAAP